MEQRIIFSKELNQDIAIALSECGHDRIFVLTDDNTLNRCWPLIKDFYTLKGAHVITIRPDDTHKDIQSLMHVWQELAENHATRQSLLINLGGGMVSDLGGFAASTFKRGINFINLPTTLLSMVDASVGGKTAINLEKLKNEVGTFCNANFVIINTDFLKTLDDVSLRAGYAEMLKHGLIANEKLWAQLINFNLANPDLNLLQDMVRDSVKVKANIVRKDPKEKGLRKSLNLGHTFGHAFETFSLRHKPIQHGYAVAFGLICELYLSCVRCGFPTDKMRQTVAFIREYYEPMAIACKDYDELISLMHHDKKNHGNEIDAVLLSGIGKIELDQSLSEEEIKEALDFYREG